MGACLFVLGLAGWPALGRKAIAQQTTERAILEKSIRRKVLDNGLELIVVENHGVPLATIEVDVKNGSFTQTAPMVGLAHMYEHMFFRANARDSEADAFADRAADLGAVFNGTTTEERVNYYITLPSDSLAAGLQAIAAALRTPLFLPDELAREKEVVLGEYDRQEASPVFGLSTEMGQKLWTDSWDRKNVIGDRSVVRAVTPDQMREIQRTYYVPNNSALLITGDVDPNRAFALAESAFGDWPRAPDPFLAHPVPPVAPLTRSAAVISEAAVGAVTVLVQWQGPSVGTDPGSTYAADVFSDALNAPGSRMQRRLVDSGLWQGVLVNYYTLNHVGPITISGQTTANKLRQALAALDQEVAAFDSAGYVTQQELAQITTQRAVNSAFGRERTSGYTHTIGFWWSVASLEYYMGYVDNMSAQTTADLEAYARRYIVGKPHITGVLIAPEDRRALGLNEQELVASPQGATP